ncbi:MAG: hypothetical protein ACE5H9_20695, partial [Anaerolineae bacterium]
MTVSAQTIRQRASQAYQAHSDFILLLLLFVTFRLLALAAYRPGGLVLDFSDFYWYREFAQLTREGYFPYDNLWTTYPPLFPSLMIAVWQASVLLPPWAFPNLWFTLSLGGVFLLFETGNFILLYLLARRIYAETALPVRVAWIYAALFVPVYTVTGWFESYPLFFFLLGLYLLLLNRPYLSAFFSSVGFMIKLIPILLLPVGVQTLLNFSPWRGGSWKSLDPARIRRVAVFLAVFVVTTVVIAWPFYRLNPALILSPIHSTTERPPWETVWALLAGNYGYGAIARDMRNLTWPLPNQPAPRLPWPWITAAFALVYVALSTARIDWRAPRILVAFAGLTVCLFFLYSKGYSPQWLVWLLAFNALLLPNLRGVIYAVVLSLANIVESNFFFIIFPEERWLLVATVLIRTALILVLAAEFSLIVWPRLRTPRLVQMRRWGVVVFLAALLIGLFPAGLRLRRAYFEDRLEQSPFSATINRLQNEAVTGALLLNSHAAYDWFYPYLRGRYDFFMFDEYGDARAKTFDLLNSIAATHDAVWVFDADPATTTPAENAASEWFGARSLAHIQNIDGGRLYLY